MPRILQAVYGSASGEHDFQILAASPGLTREEQEAVRRTSNLGGGAQRDAAPEPLWAAYAMPGGRRAFARTVFLGAGGRGNDYLAHVLILDRDALEALRGDLFLLESAFRGAAEPKPASGSSLPPLELDPEVVRARAARPLGSEASAADRSLLARVLNELCRGSARVEMSARDAVALCRALLSTLPPDDRLQLSFCTRFSYPRRLVFRLCLHQSEDRDMVERYLAAEAVAAPAPKPDPGAVESYLDLVIRRELEPVLGVSALAGPAAAHRVLKDLESWVDATRSDPLADLDERAPGVVAVARDLRNTWLPGVGSLHLEALARILAEDVQRLLAAGSPTWQELTRCLDEVLVEGPSEPLRRLFWEQRESTGASLPVHSVLGASLALHAGRDVPFGDDADAAAFWNDLANVAPRLGLEMLTRWVGTMRFTDAVRRGVGLLRAGLFRPAHLVLALAATVPGAVGSAGRQANLLGLLQTLREEVPAEVRPDLPMGQLVLREGLLPWLPAADAEALVPRLATASPQLLGQRLEAGEVTGATLRVLFDTCAGFLAVGEGGGQVHSEHWLLAGRVAATAASSGDPELLPEAAWLVYEASGWLGEAVGEPAAEEDGFGDALDALVAASPPDASVIVLRAVHRFVCAGRGPVPPTPEAASRLCAQALADAQKVFHLMGDGPGAVYWLATRQRLDALSGAWLPAEGVA